MNKYVRNYYFLICFVHTITLLITVFILRRSRLGETVSHDLLLGRWRLTLDLFGRVFMEDVGLEPGSVVSELGGFAVKEAKFRRDMEKLRNQQNRDLTLSKVCILQNFFTAYKVFNYNTLCY